MKAGFNLLLWTTHVTEEQFHLFERLKQAGYDGVEIPLFTGEVAHFRSVGQALRDNGLEATTVTVIPDEAHSCISPDPADRERGLDHLRWAIDCTAAIGGESLVGPFHQPLGVFSGTGPTEAEMESLADVHRRAADIAADAGIVLSCEPLNRFECYVLNTVADTLAHVERVGRANFGILYDTFHANIEEKDPVGCIAGVVHRINHVHVSENDRGTPGRGHVPWLETFRALAAGGYDGWLTVEAFGKALPDLAAATRVWRDFFTSPEEVYTEGLKLIRETWAAARSGDD